VTASVSEAPGDGRRSDKQNDKQNDKRASADANLAEIVRAWPTLPEPLKAGILAMVGAASGTDAPPKAEGPARADRPADGKGGE